MLRALRCGQRHKNRLSPLTTHPTAFQQTPPNRPIPHTICVHTSQNGRIFASRDRLQQLLNMDPNPNHPGVSFISVTLGTHTKHMTKKTAYPHAHRPNSHLVSSSHREHSPLCRRRPPSAVTVPQPSAATAALPPSSCRRMSARSTGGPEFPPPRRALQGIALARGTGFRCRGFGSGSA